VKQLAAELDRLGAKRALLLCTPGRAEDANRIARGLPVAGVFNRVVMHTPSALADEARRTAGSSRRTAAVAIGGGSTIGFGKAIALTSGCR
jgi:alcohol dehydrogenase class IV